MRQGALEGSGTDVADTAVAQAEARTSHAAAVEALHAQDAMWNALLRLRG